MKLPDKITIKATIIPVSALRCIEIKIPFFKCRCWDFYPSSKNSRRTSGYFFRNKSRYPKIIKNIEWV